MIDPLTALSAVASITQLLDLGIKVVAKGHKIHNSASGALVENEKLGEVTRDLWTVSAQLQISFSAATQLGPVSADDQAIFDLCDSCITASKELTDGLEKLRARGKPNAFHSLRQGIKCVWRKEQIEGLEKKLRLYRAQLDTRIITSLRTKIDLVALEQSTAFATLDAASKNLVTTLTAVSGHIENGLKTQTSKLVQLHDQTKAAVEDLALQDQHDHEATRAQVARLSLSAEERDAQIIIATATNGTAIELSLDQNLAEHKKTRQAMQVYKDQAERQIEQLTEQIRQLQIDLKASVKDMVSRMATASPREQQNLKEITNAKYNLWAALELMLEKLKAFVAMFKFNFADELWPSAVAVTTWKIMPYPRPASDQAQESESDGAARAHEQSLAYFHVDLCYPIAAGNVPMVEMCLNHGAKVNKRLPLVPYQGMTPLMKAVATAYEFTEFDSIRTILPMRHNARKIIQLLIEHGADPKQVDVDGRDAEHVAKNPQVFLSSKNRGPLPVDWLIEQSLETPPDPDVHRLFVLTDAVWAGNVAKVQGLLSEYPELCHVADDYRVSPLGVAVYCGIEEIARLLLQCGASPNGPDPTGSSPLAIAVAVDRLAITDLLLEHGAKTDITDPFLGLLPLEYAAREGNDAMCEKIIAHLRHKDRSEVAELLSKPLCLAVRHYQISTVRLLLDHRADVTTNMLLYLADWEKEAYRGAHGGLLLTTMTPRTYVENKIRERMLPPDLPSTNLLKLLIEREKRAGRQSTSRPSSEPLDWHLDNLSSKYRRVSKRRSFLSFNRSSTDITGGDISTPSKDSSLNLPSSPCT